MTSGSLGTRLGDRIDAVRDTIARAAARAGRDPAEVTLVAVSKTVGRLVIEEAYRHGLRHFGENRVQEALAKFDPPLPDDATLHLVGQLQTNKARPAVRLFGLIESVDRPSLVEALQKEAARAERIARILIQVNVAREPQKAGCDPEAAPELLARALACPNLEIRGLMTIAPLVTDPERTRPVFRQLRELRDSLVRTGRGLDLPIVSMGMTNDYPVAIEEGATHVRVGRAVFGD